MEKEKVDLEGVASQIRRDIVRMVHAVKSGHPGGSLGCVELLVALYFEVMDYHKEFSMDGKDEDIFFLSNGHISPVWYSTLARAGVIPVEELGTFRKLNSRLQGHPTTHEDLAGIRVASGSLGQGLSVALGAALTKKMNGDKHLVYALMGDGEIQEGQVWEAALNATHHKVDNLIVSIDRNGQQIDGPTESILHLENLKMKWEAFGWEVIENKEGNNIQSVIKHLQLAKEKSGKGKPVMILMHTEMGCGIDFMMGSHEWHGIPPNDEQLAKALAQLPETLGDY